MTQHNLYCIIVDVTIDQQNKIKATSLEPLPSNTYNFYFFCRGNTEIPSTTKCELILTSSCSDPIPSNFIFVRRNESIAALRLLICKSNWVHLKQAWKVFEKRFEYARYNNNNNNNGFNCAGQSMDQTLNNVLTI